jgi:hypothetical protein
VLVQAGYFPVQCDVIKESSWGRLPSERGIAEWAYLQGYGKLKADPRFVCSGLARADACFAIAALSGGLLFPPGSRQDSQRNVTALAKLVSQVATDPVGTRLDTHPLGGYLLLYEDVVSHMPDALAFQAGVAFWRELTWRPEDHFEHLLYAVQMREAARIGDALAAYKQTGFERFSHRVDLIASRIQAFDIWYEEADVVVRYEPERKEITIGVRSEEKVTELLGQGGLSMFVKDLPYPLNYWGWKEFKPAVWHTDTDPEKVRLEFNQAYAIADLLNSAIAKRATPAG